MSEYEAQARGFMQAHGIKVSATFKGDRCPSWEDGRCIHGDRYLVRLRNRRGRSITFSFWNSLNDQQEGRRPTPYDILSSVSLEAHSPTSPEEVRQEFGLETTYAQAKTIAKQAKRLQGFFTDGELSDLAEIR